MKPISPSSIRGSVLISVLVIFAVLSTLGTALLGLSTLNYKMKLVTQRQKNAFYLAEAALEEAYALISQEVETTISIMPDDEVNLQQWKQQYLTRLNENLVSQLQNHSYTILDDVRVPSPPAVTILSFVPFSSHNETCQILLESNAKFNNVFYKQKARIEIDIPNDPHQAHVLNSNRLTRMHYLPQE